jgi:CMP-N,N'-diacetyllegionaminic acid synthase
MIGGRRVLALIPARGGSKGIPGKNIIPLAGKPLLGWTVEAAQSCAAIDEIVLSTDDEAIAEIGRGLGASVPFLRSASLATDEASTMDAVFDALDRLPGFDVVVLLQPTSPLRTVADIDGCLELLDAAPACVSVGPATDHPYLTYRVDDQHRLAPFVPVSEGQSLRRQDLPGAWCLNGAVYAADIPWLRAQRSFISARTAAYAMPAERSIDVDTTADLHAAESLLLPLSKN